MGKIPTIKKNKVELVSGKILTVDSRQWFRWLDEPETTAFKFEVSDGFTARKETNGYWYGYRKINRRLHKRYLGKSSSLSLSKLSEIKELLKVPAVSKLPKSVGNSVEKQLRIDLGNLKAENISLQSDLTKTQSELVRQKNSCENLKVGLRQALGHLHDANTVFDFSRYRRLSGLKELIPRLENLLQEVNRTEQTKLT